MIQLSKILCPTDYSGASEKAVRYAIELARRVDAQVRFLHIDTMDGAADSDDEPYMPEEFSRMLLAEHKKGLQADVKVLKGSPADVIVRQAETWHADLIVMGSQGLSGLKRLMMGSVAEAVFRSAPVPVLIVRQDVTDKAVA